MIITPTIPGHAREGQICRVYYKARELALNNNHSFHLTAYAKVGSSYRWGVNSNKESAKLKRKYKDGTYGYHLHAEMDLIRKCKEGTVKVIHVIRFQKDGKVTMAKPCTHCQGFLRDHGIIKVYYTNWDGKWEVMKL